MFIIITGNPAEGFKFYGPFANWDDAITASNDIDTETDWWVVELQKVENENAKGI